MDGLLSQSCALRTPRLRLAITLAELLIVAVVLGVVALVVVPLGVNASTQRAEEAASRIQADLSYAQSQAILLRKPHCLVCDAGHGFYYLATAQAQATPIIDPVSDKPYRVHFRQACNDAVLGTTPCVAAYPDVELTDADFDGAAVVTFNALGGPLGPGGVPLAAGKIEIGIGGRRVALVIDATTGLASIQELAGP